jgi:glycosyltransferase involved in cell wall biosynthesis
MRHSIIIPTRNRNDTLALCLWSIHRSAAHCSIDDYEVIVADNGSRVPPTHETPNVKVLQTLPVTKYFNKPRCQNTAIQEARGDVLSFLDADAIVGQKWMECANYLCDRPDLTKLCYRVRLIPAELKQTLMDADAREATVAVMFDHYDAMDKRGQGRPQARYGLAHEAYGRPERKLPHPGPIFGNSQFSLRRDVLDDTRYNEAYEGRGLEDVWMIRELWKRNPSTYKAEIWTDAHHAMFHVANSLGGNDWFQSWLTKKNERMYDRSWDGMEGLLSDDTK